MAFEVIQHPRSFRLSRRVAAIAELSNVRLTALVVRSDFPDGEAEESLRLRLKVTSKSSLTQKEGFSAQVRFHLTGEGKKDSAKPLLYIRCSFMLDYSLPPDSAVKPSEIRAFAEGNVVFNVWPYFREIVHNTCARLGLSLPIVPLLRFKIAAPKKDGAKKN